MHRFTQIKLAKAYPDTVGPTNPHARSAITGNLQMLKIVHTAAKLNIQTIHFHLVLKESREDHQCVLSTCVVRRTP